jgi:hypothetical protein
LPEAVSRNESVKVVLGKIESLEVIPAAHVFTRSGKAGLLAKDFQQAIIVEMKKERMMIVELALHGPIKQAGVAVRKGC